MELQQTSLKMICVSAVRRVVAVCVDVHMHVEKMAGTFNVA
jgi:hypothetical protein